MSRISWAFIGLGAAFTAAAGYFALQPDPLPPLDLIVAGAEQDLGEVKIGMNEVSVQISNPSNQPRRVVGMNEQRDGDYSFRMKPSDNTTIPAGESCQYKFNLLIKKPGPFSAEGTLFLEGNGLQEVPLKIRGSAVAPSRKPAPSKL